MSELDAQKLLWSLTRSIQKVPDSSVPFLCSYCYRDVHTEQQKTQQQEITLLKAKIEQLEFIVMPNTTVSDLTDLQVSAFANAAVIRSFSQTPH